MGHDPCRRVLALVVVVHTLAVALAFAGQAPDRGVVPAYPKACTHGLHHQPGGGLAFVFGHHVRSLALFEGSGFEGWGLLPRVARRRRRR